MANYLTSGKNNFYVEIDGHKFANFISVSEIKGTAQVIHDIGGQDKIARKIPTKVTYEDITFVRNADPNDMELKNWFKTVIDNKVERKSMSIVIMDQAFNEKRFNMYECFPSHHSISSLNSQETGALQETITVAFENGEWA